MSENKSNLNTLLSDFEFSYKTSGYDDKDSSWFLHLPEGSITILDRVTGFGGGFYEIRDTESGYRDPDGFFWLTSGGFDIRKFEGITVREAISKIKESANTCIAVNSRRKETNN